MKHWSPHVTGPWNWAKTTEAAHLKPTFTTTLPLQKGDGRVGVIVIRKDICVTKLWGGVLEDIERKEPLYV